MKTEFQVDLAGFDVPFRLPMAEPTKQVRPEYLYQVFLAERDEILVSSTVKDLVTGSDFEFEDRGKRSLKGVPGVWRLSELASGQTR